MSSGRLSLISVVWICSHIRLSDLARWWRETHWSCHFHSSIPRTTRVNRLRIDCFIADGPECQYVPPCKVHSKVQHLKLQCKSINHIPPGKATQSLPRSKLSSKQQRHSDQRHQQSNADHHSRLYMAQRKPPKAASLHKYCKATMSLSVSQS